jgi:tetratricopeptide (TPR) repeat protein
VPPEVLINVGTLSIEVGKFKEAMDIFEEALAVINKLLDVRTEVEEREKLIAMKVTARFNISVNFENMAQQERAAEIYKTIIEEQPTYLDAYLRLAYLNRDQGQFQNALDLIEQAKKNITNAPPVYQFCVKGKLLLDANFTEQSLQEFKYL